MHFLDKIVFWNWAAFHSQARDKFFRMLLCLTELPNSFSEGDPTLPSNDPILASFLT